MTAGETCGEPATRGGAASALKSPCTSHAVADRNVLIATWVPMRLVAPLKAAGVRPFVGGPAVGGVVVSTRSRPADPPADGAPIQGEVVKLARHQPVSAKVAGSNAGRASGGGASEVDVASCSEMMPPSSETT